MRSKITSKNELKITFERLELPSLLSYVNEITLGYKDDLPTTEYLNLMQVVNKLHGRLLINLPEKSSIVFTASECSSLVQLPSMNCASEILNTLRQVTAICDAYIKNSFNISKINRTALKDQPCTQPHIQTIHT